MEKNQEKNIQLDDYLLTVQEVAKATNSYVQYIYKLHNAGLLRFMKLGRLKVRKKTLEEFLAKWDGWDLTDPYHPIPLEKSENEG